MLVMIKAGAILYERTVALCASMDFGKCLGRWKPYLFYFIEELWSQYKIQGKS